jgi:hypothetical protein
VTLLNRPILALATAALLCLSPLAAAVAQELKPVAVVSIASVKETLNDIGYVTRVAGMPDQGDAIRFLASAYVSGIDRERSIGLYFVPQGGEFRAVAFVPMEDKRLAEILERYRESIGEAKDAGDGVQQLGRGRTVFVKEQAGWAFFAERKEFLSGLPADPATLLGDLPKNYNVAVKLFVQNIPPELRRTGIDELKLGIERFLDSPAAQKNNIDRDQAQQLSKMYVGNLEKLLTEGEELMIGIGINETAKNIVLDLGGSALANTSLARTMALQADAKTNFAGFALPDAAVTMSLASKTTPEDIAQVRQALQAYRTQIAKQIDDSPDIPANKREAIKGLLGPLFDVIGKTIESGRLDGGATVLLLPKSLSFAFGGSVVDGPAVEKLLIQVADLAKDVPNAPKLQLNVGTIGEMKLNRLTAAIPEHSPEARDILGEKLDIIIGIGPKSVIVSGGRNAEGLLKSVLDKSAQEKEKAIPPFQLAVGLLPILRFSQSIDDNPIVKRMIASLEQGGSDHINITSQVTPRSSTTRIEIQEGIIRAGGEAAKSAGAGLPRGAQ